MRLTFTFFHQDSGGIRLRQTPKARLRPPLTITPRRSWPWHQTPMSDDFSINNRNTSTQLSTESERASKAHGFGSTWKCKCHCQCNVTEAKWRRLPAFRAVLICCIFSGISTRCSESTTLLSVLMML